MPEHRLKQALITGAWYCYGMPLTFIYFFLLFIRLTAKSTHHQDITNQLQHIQFPCPNPETAPTRRPPALTTASTGTPAAREPRRTPPGGQGHWGPGPKIPGKLGALGEAQRRKTPVVGRGREEPWSQLAASYHGAETPSVPVAFLSKG